MLLKNALAVINGERRQEFSPPPSTPSAAGQSPAATVAAEPPDEPPDTLALSYGFRLALQIYCFSIVRFSTSGRNIAQRNKPKTSATCFFKPCLDQH
jgi:hypothetical protein